MATHIGTCYLETNAYGELQIYLEFYDTGAYSYDIQVMGNGVNSAAIGYRPSGMKINGYWQTIYGVSSITSRNVGTFVVLVRESRSNPWYSSYDDRRTLSNEPLPSDSYGDTHIPSYYPFVHDQWVWADGSWHTQANSCVAHSLATVYEIQYKLKRGYAFMASVGWIFGNRKTGQWQGDGLMYDEAISNLISDGVPQHTDMPPLDRPDWRKYPDVYALEDFYAGGKTYIGAKTLVNQNYSSKISIANQYRTSSYLSYGTELTNVATIKQIIQNHGCALVDIYMLANNFANTLGSDGVVPQPDYYYSSWAHSLVIIGWKLINGKLHWICQNSWGDWYGDGGRAYLPVDYVGIRGYYKVVIEPTYVPFFVNVSSTEGTYITDKKFLNLNADTTFNASYMNFNNVTLGTITSYGTPFTAKFDLSKLPDGEHVFRARPYDSEGNASSIYADITIGLYKQTPSIISKTVYYYDGIGRIDSYGNIDTTSNSIGVKVNLSGFVDFVNYHLEHTGSTLKISNTTNNNEVTATIDLSMVPTNTNTEINIRPYKDEVVSGNNLIVGLTVDRSAPTLSIIRVVPLVGGFDVVVQTTDYTSKGGGTIVRILDYTYGTLIVDKTIYDQNGQDTYTFTGLEINKKYKIETQTWDGLEHWSPIVTTSATTKADRPDNWDWTVNAISGVKQKGSTLEMYAPGKGIVVGKDEWYNFQKRINQFRAYYNNGSLPQFAFYNYYNGRGSFTTPQFRGDEFDYYYFNQANNAINQMKATGLSDKSSGNIVSADDLNKLRTIINSIV